MFTPRTPFARLEQRTHRAGVTHLANATALVGGVQVPVIYDQPHTGVNMGLAEACQPEFTAQTTDVDSLRNGERLIVQQGQQQHSYRVASTEPDGTGMTRVILEQAP